MTEIPPVSQPYPVKKPNKIIRQRKRPPDKQKSSESEDHKKDENGQANEPADQHIDEIV